VDPYKLDAARVTAEAPEDYVDFGNKGQKIINNYAIAVKQGAISLNDVPEVYRTATYQKMITNSTDKAADRILQTGLNTALFLADPVGYSLGYAGQKAAAYANDRLNMGLEICLITSQLKEQSTLQNIPWLLFLQIWLQELLLVVLQGILVLSVLSYATLGKLHKMPLLRQDWSEKYWLTL